MHLCSRFLASVFRPIHAIGNQLNGCGINSIYGALHTSWYPNVAFPSWTAAVSKLWMHLLKLCLDFPKEFLCHVSIADFVGMGKTIATGGSAFTQSSQNATVIS